MERTRSTAQRNAKGQRNFAQLVCHDIEIREGSDKSKDPSNLGQSTSLAVDVKAYSVGLRSEVKKLISIVLRQQVIYS